MKVGGCIRQQTRRLSCVATKIMSHIILKQNLIALSDVSAFLSYLISLFCSLFWWCLLLLMSEMLSIFVSLNFFLNILAKYRTVGF